MIGAEPPYQRDLVPLREPLRHVAIFLGVAAALFLMCVVIFHVLERVF